MTWTKTTPGPTVAEAFAALQRALRDDDPACLGDARFTSDDADPAPLRLVCHECPVFAQCNALGKANPQGRVYGVLGGLVRRAEPKPRRSDLVG